MRAIEASIVERMGGEKNLKLDERRSVIPLSNFYGIEIKGFAAEIARLALLIAEFQADCLYLSQQEARAMVLPLHKTGQIHIGNSLRTDWRDVCPPAVKTIAAQHDVGRTSGRRSWDDEVAVEEEQSETYICGNPPYKGSQEQDAAQKADLAEAFSGTAAPIASADYVSGWFVKARQLAATNGYAAAFVTTNSIHQGRQVASLWTYLFSGEIEIGFARPSFKWSNLASKQAVVTVSVIGIRKTSNSPRYLFEGDSKRMVDFIGPYLLPNNRTLVEPRAIPASDIPPMNYGSMPNDGGHLILSLDEARALRRNHSAAPFVKPFWGAGEIVAGVPRFCVWVEKGELAKAEVSTALSERFGKVKQTRLATSRKATNILADVSWRFGEVRQTIHDQMLVVPIHTSENREVLPTALLDRGEIVSNACYQLANAPLWVLAILSARSHLAWIATVCGKLERFPSHLNR